MLKILSVMLRYDKDGGDWRVVSKSIVWSDSMEGGVSFTLYLSVCGVGVNVKVKCQERGKCHF